MTVELILGGGVAQVFDNSMLYSDICRIGLLSSQYLRASVI